MAIKKSKSNKIVHKKKEEHKHGKPKTEVEEWRIDADYHELERFDEEAVKEVVAEEDEYESIKKLKEANLKRREADLKRHRKWDEYHAKKDEAHRKWREAFLEERAEQDRRYAELTRVCAEEVDDGSQRAGARAHAEWVRNYDPAEDPYDEEDYMTDYSAD